VRLFIALDPSPEVCQNLERLLARLRPTARLRWSRPQNIHLTLKFIGEWPESRLAELRQALGDCAPPPTFQVRVAGLGFFPNPRAPRVFWAGIAPCPELIQFAGDIDLALAALGVPREQRPYSAHLTLARIQGRTPLGELHQAIAGLGEADFASFQPGGFFLYESRRGPAGSVYTRIGEFGWAR